MNKQEITNQIIRDIFALPNAKYFAMILQEGLRQDPSNAVFRWLFYGKYIDDDDVNSFIEEYTEGGTREYLVPSATGYTMKLERLSVDQPSTIRSIVGRVIQSVGKYAWNLLASEILKLFASLPKDTIVSLIRKQDLINAMNDIDIELFSGSSEYDSSAYLVNFLVTGQNDEPERLEEQYDEFILNPKKLVEDTLGQLSGFNYENALLFARFVIGMRTDKEPELEKIDKLPYDEQLAYALDLINIPEIQDDVDTIYKYFYPVYNIPNI